MGAIAVRRCKAATHSFDSPKQGWPSAPKKLRLGPDRDDYPAQQRLLGHSNASGKQKNEQSRTRKQEGGDEPREDLGSLPGERLVELKLLA